jgi:hypothetical protein
VKYELLHQYPTLAEKKGELVAQFKFTVAIRNEGPLIVAGLPVDVTKFSSEYKLADEGVLKLLEVVVSLI